MDKSDWGVVDASLVTYKSRWGATAAPRKRKIIGIWMIVAGRYIAPFVALAGVEFAWDINPSMVAGLINGGLLLGFIGLGIYIWGIVGEDRVIFQKNVAILLSIGIVLAGWIGLGCIITSLIVSLSAKKRSRQLDNQEMNQW